MVVPGKVRLRRECIELPFTMDDEGRPLVVVIESIPPLDMVELAKRLPGEWLQSIERLQERDAKKEQGVSDQELNDIRDFYANGVNLIERGVVGMLDPETGEVVPAKIRFSGELDDETIDGRVLHLTEASALTFRILEISGWGGGLAERVGRFRIWELGGLPRGERDVANHAGNGAESAPAAGVPVGAGGGTELVSPAGGGGD